MHLDAVRTNAWAVVSWSRPVRRRGLLDTSVVIAVARGEEVELPDQAAISTVTLCGLHHGVLIAATALSHGLPLYSRDRGFERLGVSGLRLV